MTLMGISGEEIRFAEIGRLGWLFRPKNIAPLIVLRVAFGVLMFVSMVRFMAKGWIEELYVAPRIHFTYYGFDWVRPLSANGMWVVFVTLAILSVCVMLGLFYRPAIIALFFLFTWVELLDKSYYLNHYYFISVLSFLLIFLPLNGAFSVDNWLGITPTRAHVPAWCLYSVRLLVALVYIYAGMAKLNPDWLLRAQPLQIWLNARAQMPVLGLFFDQTWFAFLMSWGGMLFDLTIPLWLSWHKTRRVAYGLVVGFHLMTALLFQIGMFPWVMIALTLVFFDWQFVPTTSTQTSPLARKWVVVPLCLLFLQLIIPLRHHLYAGNVAWTEEGARFAWRVMLDEKTGSATFYIHDSDGSLRMVRPSDYLTLLQEQQMVFQPDMILQFAHFLEAEAGRDVGVSAEIYVSHNGRASRLFIDPTIDLTNYSPSLLPKSWIMQ